MFTCVLSASSLSSAEESDLKTYVSQWVDVQRNLGDEETRWKRDQVVLADSAVSLEEEIAGLKESITESEKVMAGFDETSKEKLDEKEGYEKARTVLADKLPELEKRLISYKNNIPEFALKSNARLMAAYVAIEKSQEEDKQNALNGRLTDVINVLAELEKLQQTVTLREEQLTLGGEDKLVSVVYFGLATAYAANKSGSVAAIGSIKPDEGWVFTESPEFSEQIVKLVQVANGEGQVDFTSLPVFIK